VSLEAGIALAVWLVLLLGTGALFVRTARRMTRLAAIARGLAAYQSALTGIRDRVTAAVDPVLARIDELRRRSGDPGTVPALVAEAIGAVEAALADARAARPPAALSDRSATVIAELERMARALDLIEHAFTSLAGIRGPRELEIQTTLKRGALNLRHARDAVVLVASEVGAVRASDLRAGTPHPRALTAPVALGTPASRGDVRDDGGPEPII
jgi:hypothetical protein